MNKSSRHFLLFAFLIIAYVWINLFTTLQERQKFIRKLVQSNTNIPTIMFIPVLIQSECDSEVKNLDITNDVSFDVETCIREQQSLASSTDSRDTVDLTRIIAINCESKAILQPTRTTDKTKIPCSKIIRYDKWIEFFNIPIIKVGEKIWLPKAVLSSSLERIV